MKTKKKIFDIPYVGYDYGEENGWDYDVLLGKHGNPIIGIKIKNVVEQYSADPYGYENFHGVLNQAVTIIGEDRIVQKLDIFSKKIYSAENSKEFLQQKYSEHFSSRPYKTIDTLLLFTDALDKKNKYAFSDKDYKDLRDKCQKIFMLLEQSDCQPQFLHEKDFEYYIGGILSMSFKDIPGFNNIKSNDDYLNIGNNSYVKTISYVDVENIILPSEVNTFSTIGGNGIVSDTAVDNFSFLNEIDGYETIVYNQIISVPHQTRQMRELEKKKKKHEGVASNTPANAIVAEEIETLLHNVSLDGQLIVNAHFSLVFSTKSFNEMEKLQSIIDNKLFTKGIVVSKNSYNQLELFRCCLPGNSTELKEYDLFITTSEAALCFFFKESYTINEKSNFYLRFTDRQGVPLKVDLADLPMKTGRINNRNKFVLGPSGSGKSFLMNNIVEQYLAYNYDVIIVDTGDSYSGTCSYKGGRYIQYTEEKPITMNPFLMNENEFNIEKIEFLVNLVFLIWQGSDATITATQKSILDNLLISYYDQYFNSNKEWWEGKNDEELLFYLEKFNIYSDNLHNDLEKDLDYSTNKDYQIVFRKFIIKRIKTLSEELNVKELSFNSFYEYAEKFLPIYLNNKKYKIDEKEFNTKTFFFVLKDFYKGGRYGTTLNESADNTLFDEPFIVFEIDNVKDNPKLFPIVTLIIMDTFIQKMRLRKDRRKALIIEEAWKAIASKLMGGYILYLYKTVRKFWGEAIVVTQELDDIIGNAVVKDSIINNSDTFILLDQTKFKDNFDRIASLLSLNKVEQNKIFTINNLDNKQGRSRFKEFYLKRGSKGEVYGNEVSLEQYLTYTTEKPEKSAVEYYVNVLGNYDEALEVFVKDLNVLGENLDVMVSLINLYKKPLDEHIIGIYREEKSKHSKENLFKAIENKLKTVKIHEYEEV